MRVSGCSSVFGIFALVRLPTHTHNPEDILNGNHKQLRGGKGSAAHQQINQPYIHANSAGDRVYGLTPEHSKSRTANTPDSKILYF